MTQAQRMISKAPVLPSRRIAITRLGQHGEDGPTVYIFADVLDEIIVHASYREDLAATLLLGGYYQGPAGPYVEIQGFAESIYVARTLDLFRLFQEGHQRVRDNLARDNPHQCILGWSHNISGQNAEVSAQSYLIHRTFFNRPEQIFISMDVSQELLGAYRVGQGKKMENLGFNLISMRGQPLPFGQTPDATEDTLIQPAMSALHEEEDDSPTTVNTALGTPTDFLDEEEEREEREEAMHAARVLKVRRDEPGSLQELKRRRTMNVHHPSPALMDDLDDDEEDIIVPIRPASLDRAVQEDSLATYEVEDDFGGEDSFGERERSRTAIAHVPMDFLREEPLEPLEPEENVPDPPRHTAISYGLASAEDEEDLLRSAGLHQIERPASKLTAPKAAAPIDENPMKSASTYVGRTVISHARLEPESAEGLAEEESEEDSLDEELVTLSGAPGLAAQEKAAKAAAQEMIAAAVPLQRSSSGTSSTKSSTQSLQARIKELRRMRKNNSVKPDQARNTMFGAPAQNKQGEDDGQDS